MCLRTCAGVFIHSNEAWQTVTAMAARQVDTHSVGLAVMHLGHTLVDIWGQTKQIQRIDTSNTHTEWFVRQLVELAEINQHRCINLNSPSHLLLLIGVFCIWKLSRNCTHSSITHKQLFDYSSKYLHEEKKIAIEIECRECSVVLDIHNIHRDTLQPIFTDSFPNVAWKTLYEH